MDVSGQGPILRPQNGPCANGTMAHRPIQARSKMYSENDKQVEKKRTKGIKNW